MGNAISNGIEEFAFFLDSTKECLQTTLLSGRWKSKEELFHAMGVGRVFMRFPLSGFKEKRMFVHTETREKEIYRP